MEKLIYFNKFYLDKEKDIQVHLYKTENIDELCFIIRTPNHKTGNLISNIAKICNLPIEKDESDMKIIKGIIPASLNGDNEEVYILRLGGMKIANIYNDRIEVKARIPVISKTLMSQTKDYKLNIHQTILKSYVLKKLKFRTDLHTHMNANLSPDVLIALGIKRQLRYPLYYIKKLNLKLTEKQEEIILKRRIPVEKEYENCGLTGKYLTRRIDDNTFINFADLILNNIENAKENISKIRNSLVILKDGQAVFTNLEKLYLYRYVFCKGKTSDDLIKLNKADIEKIPEEDIKNYLFKMLEDAKPESKYANNTLRQDKYLWIAREYKKQGIYYTEITDTDLNKLGEPAIKVLEDAHDVLPKIEEDTGVKIRFLMGLRRIPLTIKKEEGVTDNYLADNLIALYAVAKDPYVVGSDFIGEEINDISELKPMIKELVKYANNEDEGFTIRIHAGENDSLRDNVKKSIECVKESVSPGKKIPRFRIGHGLYTANLNSKEGKELICEMKETGVVLEFQFTSNVRLNNLTNLKHHPLKKYLENGIKCVQGTDGCGIYGVDTIDEQLSLQNLIGLSNDDFEKMRKVEDEIISYNDNYFEEKKKKFEKICNGRSIRETILDLEEKYKKIVPNINLRVNNKLNSEEELKNKIKALPIDKVPIIIAGGSFNTKHRKTVINESGLNTIKELVNKVDSNKVYFVVGHKMQGYEKALVDIAKEYNKNLEIDAIIPKAISKEEKNRLISEDELNGVCISNESEGFGIYKSFNYEIFERRKSIVVAFDGNSPVSNLVQEAKNGKGKARIYVNSDVTALKDKANSLGGYVVPFKVDETIVDTIINDNPEIV